MAKTFNIVFTVLGKAYQFQVYKLLTVKKLEIERWLVWNESTELELELQRPALNNIPGDKFSPIRWTIIKGEASADSIVDCIIKQIIWNAVH